MKNLLLIFMLFALAATTGAQCPQIVLKNNDIKAQTKNSCLVTIADPGHIQYNYDLFWQDSVGGWHKVACLSGFHYVPKYNPDHSVDESGSYTTIGITNAVVPGHPMYGLKNGAAFYIVKHCQPQSSLQNCYNDMDVSPTSAYYQVKFKN